jgi:hypothetical protein
MILFFLKRCFLTFCLLCVSAAALVAQNVQIILGPNEIGENQAWTITVTVQNERLKSYDNFPDITGFVKRGTSSQSTTNIVNGNISSSQSVIMTYLPAKQGTFTIPTFTMKVNDKSFTIAGKKVKVGPPVQQQRDPFSGFFDRDPYGTANRGETEFVDLKEDAFLALTTNKNEVYVGEGFQATFSFFLSEQNQAPFQFYDLNKQLTDVLKKLKPANCWEENFNIENINAERVTINGKVYDQYKIYQAVYYPFNAESIQFPTLALEMIKYKVAKNPSFFGQNRKEDFKKFYTKPKTVKVKQLPPHALRDVVAVGDYRLDERMRTTDLETGQSAAYEFHVVGEGNISAVEKPNVKQDGAFEWYEPNIRQDINRDNSRVTGRKSFSYFMIPKEPGKFNLADYVQWVFFNPKEKKYDTLKSQLTVYVTGESKKNEVIQSNDLGSFYDKIGDEDNTLLAIRDTRWQKWAFNGFIALMLMGAGYLIFKK